MRPFAPALLLIVVGAVVLAATSGTAATAVGMLLGGAGGIWLVSAAFFMVGRSEDADRERHPRG